MVCFLMGLCLLAPGLFGQETETAAEKQKETIPNVLRRPERGGEAPRFPQDLVIGELGRRETSDAAWLFARNLVSSLVAGSTAAPEGAGSVITESIREEINSIEPRTYRLGSGRVEPDGCVSFLVRFLGSEESITGELFVRRQEEKPDSSDSANSPEIAGSVETKVSEGTIGSHEVRWTLDDLILEEKRSLAEIRDSYRFDFSPYERFY